MLKHQLNCILPYQHRKATLFSSRRFLGRYSSITSLPQPTGPWHGCHGFFSEFWSAGLSHHVLWVYVGIKQACHGNAQFLLLGEEKRNKHLSKRQSLVVSGMIVVCVVAVERGPCFSSAPRPFLSLGCDLPHAQCLFFVAPELQCGYMWITNRAIIWRRRCGDDVHFSTKKNSKIIAFLESCQSISQCSEI